MCTIAGSAVAFVFKAYLDSRRERRQQFFDLMDLIDNKGSIAAKVAAIYQLRFFPEHKDFIIRFCDTQKNNISGSGIAADSLRAEFEKTADFFQ
jgi:hypothetical protein